MQTPAPVFGGDSTGLLLVTSAGLVEAASGVVGVFDGLPDHVVTGSVESLQFTRFGVSEMLLYGYTAEPLFLDDGTNLSAGFL